MKRSRSWLRPTILAAVLLFAGWWLYLEHVNPHYNGKRVSQWLHALESDSEADVVQAKSAIQELGPRAWPQVKLLLMARDVDWIEKASSWVSEHTRWEIEPRSAWKDRHLGVEALKELKNAYQTFVPDVIQMLANKETAGIVMEVFREIDPAAQEFLFTSLKDSNPKIRYQSVVLLSFLDNPNRHQAVLLLLSDEDPEVREQAVLAIGGLDQVNGRLLSEICRLSKDPNENVRCAAVSLLCGGAEEVPALVPQLMRCFDDPSPKVKVMVSGSMPALIHLHPSVAPVLERALRDSNSDISQKALESIVVVCGGELYPRRFNQIIACGFSGRGAEFLRLEPSHYTEYNRTAATALAANHTILLPAIERHFPSARNPYEGNTTVYSAWAYVAPGASSRRARIKELLDGKNDLEGCRVVHNGYLKICLPSEKGKQVVDDLKAISEANPEVGKYLQDSVFGVMLDPALEKTIIPLNSITITNRSGFESIPFPVEISRR